MGLVGKLWLIICIHTRRQDSATTETTASILLSDEDQIFIVVCVSEATSAINSFLVVSGDWV